MHIHQLNFYIFHSIYFQFACNERSYDSGKPAGFRAYYPYVVVKIHSMWNELFVAHRWSVQEESTPVTV